MKKNSKKDLQKQIVDTLDQMFAGYYTNAAIDIKKSIKSAGKMLSKKFNKEVKKFEKENLKGNKLKVATKKPTIVKSTPSVRKRR